MEFEITAQCGAARRGRLTLAHGTVETPVSMPVGTYGTVKAMAPNELEALGAEIVLGNTFHLWLRPGVEVIAAHAGLHRFMGWSHPILTDSGGFQVFSLGPLRNVHEEGVTFASPVRYAESMREKLGPRPYVNGPAGPFNFIRKMACNFGWDWGPGLPTCGIWRGIRLEGWSAARIASLTARVTQLDHDEAKLEMRMSVERTATWFAYNCTLTTPSGEIIRKNYCCPAIRKPFEQREESVKRISWAVYHRESQDSC